MAIQTLTLNVNAQPSAEDRAFLRLSQNENGRDIRFRVLGADLPSGCTATLSGVKPDGNVWSKAGTVTNNFVIVEEDIQMTAVAGRWDAQLDIVSGSENIVTALIRIAVEAAAVDAGAVPSDTQLEGYVEQCKQYAESAKNEAYGSPLTAATAAAMTDQRRVYVYTGSESGYINGHWYYYDGNAWVSGGIYNNSAAMPYEVIESIDDMVNVTKDRVLVLHNNSPWGTGGPCWFEYLSYATEGGYARKDGGKMYPMLDQGPLIASTPPVERMMSIISSYVENENLIYGNDNTLFESTTTNEIDCSAFVSAVLHGIAYSFSKYVGDANRRTERISSYSPTLLTDTPRPPLRRLRTRYMAQYFAEQGWLHKMPSTYNMRDILQFGDILFSWDGKENSTNRFLKIAHVSIVLAVRDGSNIVVAQCGGYPAVVTTQDNVKDPTLIPQIPGKISTINLTPENISTYFSAFARIPYVAQNDTAFVGGKLKPVFIPNTYIDEGRMGVESISGICATSYGYIKVNPSSVITFTGATSYRGYELIPMVAEYDEHMQYLAKGRFTSADKTLTANTRYIKLCYAHPSTGDRPPMLLEDIDQFEATITL